MTSLPRHLTPTATRRFTSMKTKFFLVTSLFLILIQLLGAAPERRVLNFNPEWKLGVGDYAGAEQPDFDDSKFVDVTLPRAWNEDDAFQLDIHHHRTGIAWYRKHFKLPQHAPQEHAYIEFEGARQLAEVWLNGIRIGSHENGVMAFGFEISKALKPWPEENVIAVRTDNAWDYKERLSGQGFQWSDRNFNANYGGLTKNVRLHLTGELHQSLPLYSTLGTTGVYVWASDIDVGAQKAMLHVESEVLYAPRQNQPFEYVVEIRDRDGALVSTFSGGQHVAPSRGRIIAKASAKVDNLKFWSWGYGYLYEVTTLLKIEGVVVDRVVTKTGFRKTAFTDGVIRLNDRVIQVKGYAQRTSNEWPAIGLSVPPWLSDYSNALMIDSGANMVRWMHVTPWKQDVESCDRVGLMQMLPAGDSERDASGRKWVQRMELMRDAIIYNRNNPSVIVYECGNNDISEEHMAEMKNIRNRFDPHGGRAIGSRNMLGSKEAEYGGEMLYINKSAGIPYWQTEYSRDEGLRKYWDEFSPPFHPDGEGPLYRERPALSYNRNQDSHAIENVERWYDYWRERPGTGTRVNGGGLNIIFSDTNTHYRGAENYRRSGEVDAMRIPKDGFFAHQVMWNGWVDPEGPMLHILGHWNYEAGVKKDIFVVGNTDRVELLLNEKSLGEGVRSHHYLFTFPDVEWQAGILQAVGKDKNGVEVANTSHQTIASPKAIRLTQIGPNQKLKADGADLALLEVEVIDANGKRCPIAMNTITFTIEGPAEWRGGIAQGPDNFILSQTLPVECGVNRVLIRSTVDAGAITIRANAKDLTSDSIQIESQPVTVQNGWSEEFPADGLQSMLEGGSTPEGSSITPTRNPIAVKSATCASGNDISLAFDDNEATAWVGKGPVHFEFERVAKVNEITLKTGGFRARSYPIRIKIGEKEVFFGTTTRSLGYITLPLEATTGNELLLEILEGSEAQDAFGNITELVDQGNATTGEESVGGGEMSIIEIEFYEAIP